MAAFTVKEPIPSETEVALDLTTVTVAPTTALPVAASNTLPLKLFCANAEN